MAAVYPESMCKALVKDVKRFLDYRNTSQGYYKCERCAMGRAATADVEHNFLPGECRYGKWPEGEDPRERKRLEREQQQKDDIFDSLRKEALKNEKVMQGRLAAHPSLSFNSEQTAILKMCLIKLLSEAVDFDVLEKRPRTRTMSTGLKIPQLRNVFKEYLDVQGAIWLVCSLGAPLHRSPSSLWKLRL